MEGLPAPDRFHEARPRASRLQLVQDAWSGDRFEPEESRRMNALVFALIAEKPVVSSAVDG